MDDDSNLKSDENASPEKKGIPLRWILYAILTYAFFQTLYIWWQVRGA
ncbi:hypothetical protein [Puniceicoccus vermicola]|uniref:Uncharacterized protein n=1 Tax=Puniceicoccus vermicola TaxID=388746 RepID=A0A7X1B0E2_9BACT|nr:hypothetical protein [Puniceicoccus vermicola]MBC2603323.1 hypothetical protein [Puniceicoccus vermicola]